MQDEPRRVDRRDGPTPAGGAYSEAYYDGDRLVEVVEFDEHGRQLHRTYAATGLAAFDAWPIPADEAASLDDDALARRMARETGWPLVHCRFVVQVERHGTGPAGVDPEVAPPEPGKGAKRRIRVKPGIYYRKDASGRRRYEVSYYDNEGRRRWKVVDGKLEDAEAERDNLRGRVRRGERVAPSTRATFAEVAEAWLAAQTELRPRTRQVYRWALDSHVLPRLGRRRISSIAEDDVTGLIAAMRKPAKGRPQGYAPWTIRAVLTPLSRVLGYAVKRGMLAANPVRALERGERPAAVERREKRVLTSDEVAKLLDAALPTYRPILATATFSGLRLGELLGLTWADVDLDAGFLRVRKALDREGRRVEPKTAQAVRDVVLVPALAKLLREHMAASGYSRPADPVFASESGRPHNGRNVSQRGLDKAADRAGLHGDGKAKITMHSLRRTFASHLILDLKLDPVRVSRLMGHARPSITEDTYAAMFDQARHADEIREAMAASHFGTILERAGGDAWQNPTSDESGEVVDMQEFRH